MADWFSDATVVVPVAAESDGKIDPGAYADVTISPSGTADGLLPSFISPIFIPITISTMCGYRFVGPMVLPSPPKSASNTDPAMATGHLVRPLFGIIVDPTGGSPQ